MLLVESAAKLLKFSVPTETLAVLFVLAPVELSVPMKISLLAPTIL